VSGTLVADLGIMAPLSEALLPENGATCVWDLIWEQLEHLITELNRALGAHLRERPIAAWRPGCRASTGGVLIVGRGRLELELDVDGDAPTLLGTTPAVLRLTALATSSRRTVGVLWVDPTTRRWTSTETEGELFALDDRLALERFFLALFVSGD
jgi:hypothetical protein